jgi:hypothetical protein
MLRRIIVVIALVVAISVVLVGRKRSFPICEDPTP